MIILKNDIRKSLRAKQIIDLEAIKEELRDIYQEILDEKSTKIRVTNNLSDE